MSKTENLGLNLTTDETTTFSDWRKSIDGENASEKSNMQIIDEAYKGLSDKVDNISNNNTGNSQVYYIMQPEKEIHGYNIDEDGNMIISGIKYVWNESTQSFEEEAFSEIIPKNTELG